MIEDIEDNEELSSSLPINKIYYSSCYAFNSTSDKEELAQMRSAVIRQMLDNANRKKEPNKGDFDIFIKSTEHSPWQLYDCVAIYFTSDERLTIPYYSNDINNEGLSTIIDYKDVYEIKVETKQGSKKLVRYLKREFKPKLSFWRSLIRKFMGS